MKKWHKIAEGRCDMLSESWNPDVFGDCAYFFFEVEMPNFNLNMLYLIKVDLNFVYFQLSKNVASGYNYCNIPQNGV